MNRKKPKTFVEKIFSAPAGAIVFAKPDIILSHDNTSSIYKTFQKMGGNMIHDPGQLLVVLDHNAPPTDSKMANQYQEIRNLVDQQNVSNFYDSGNGICHQLMANHARPGMIIVGSDSHTSTAGAFNAFAAGIDRTEAAGIWKRGDTWFMVPGSLKIYLSGKLPENASSKDLSLWIIGMIGSDGANYLSVEYHGPGVNNLSIEDRMVLANMASEMGAKNAVFPADEILSGFYGKEIKGIWADPGAEYINEIYIDMNDIFPVVAAPHYVDNVISVADASGTHVDEGLIGTCTNGRIEDLRIAAGILKGKKIQKGFQLSIIPASRKIYLQAIKEGIIENFLESGANVLTPSCGPCLGTGQGIPASGHTVISTANRNFSGRMGNKEAIIYLASPATVATSALSGVITYPGKRKKNDKFPFSLSRRELFRIVPGDSRKVGEVWNYSDVDNLNTDLMFAGKYTYNIMSTDAEGIMQHLFEDFDPEFSKSVNAGDIMLAGENFGCGSSREHPSVGLAYAGIKGIIAKSVNRIFFRSSINQGLILIVHKEAVETYKRGDKVQIDFENGKITVGERVFTTEPLPEKLKLIIANKGLVNYMRGT